MQRPDGSGTRTAVYFHYGLSAMFDFGRDGDRDFVIATTEKKFALYENTLGDGEDWLLVASGTKEASRSGATCI